MHAAVLLVVLLLGAWSCSAGPALDRITLDANGRFRDGLGRQRIFHGFNRVNKVFPWYAPELLNLARLALYQKWGFNAARMGCMWSGAVPQKNQVNQTYLDITMDTVRSLADHGIYALLDMHQVRSREIIASLLFF